MTPKSDECPRCGRQVLELRGFGGIIKAVMDRDGGLAQLQGVLRKIVNDWEEAPIGGPRVKKSDAERWRLIRFSSHDRVCTPSVRPTKPINTATTKPYPLKKAPPGPRGR